MAGVSPYVFFSILFGARQILFFHFFEHNLTMIWQHFFQMAQQTIRNPTPGLPWGRADQIRGALSLPMEKKVVVARAKTCRFMLKVTVLFNVWIWYSDILRNIYNDNQNDSDNHNNERTCLGLSTINPLSRESWRGQDNANLTSCQSCQ